MKEESIMRLFIDTNIFLSFFHYSNEDLEELRKLVVLVSAKKVTLYLPEQVRDEFYRNRDGKIADALRQFTDEKLATNFPQFCKQYDEYSELRKLIQDYQKTKDALLEKIREDFKQERFKADFVIKDLFSAADKIKVSDNIFNDEKKNRLNQKNHDGISFDEAETVFDDLLAIYLHDDEHSWGEQRLHIIGESAMGDILVVTYTERGSRIRIISARRPTRRELRDYQKGNL